MRRGLLAAAAAALLMPAAGADETIREAVREDYRAHLGALFEHFHRHPELSFRETATAARLAEELRSSDSVDITVYGVGAHGAAPHKGKDPIYLASQIVVALQGLVSRELSPLEPGVVTVGSFHGGFKHNIIPDQVKLQLTVRADSEATRAKLLAGIERIAEGVARTAGLPDELMPKVDLSIEATPTTSNDVALAARIRETFARELGPEMLYDKPRQGMGAEDFAYFVQTEDRVPGVYFVVGGTPQAVLDAEEAGGPPVPSHHSPFFEIEPEPAVVTGVHAMTVAVLELLAKP